MRKTQLCKKCLKPLPTDVNGKLLTTSDICPECHKEGKMENIDWDEKKVEFENLIEEIRQEKGNFDGLVMLSGGKDSVYVAYLLSKIYNLNIVGLTIDNGFEYENTFDNSSDLAKKLGISHFIYRLPYNLMKEYYRFLLTDETLKLKDCSQICFFCGRLLKSIAIKVAKQLEVSAVFSGHTNEQVRALGEETGNDPSYKTRQRYIKSYTAKNYDKAISALRQSNHENVIPLLDDNIEINEEGKHIYPLQYFEYKPLEITQLLEKEVGWVADSHFTKKYISSGCKLAKLMEYVAYKNGTDTYVVREFSDQIRRGSLTIGEVNEIIDGRLENKDEIEDILSELSLCITDIS